MSSDWLLMMQERPSCGCCGWDAGPADVQSAHFGLVLDAWRQTDHYHVPQTEERSLVQWLLARYICEYTSTPTLPAESWLSKTRNHIGDKERYSLESRLHFQLSHGHTVFYRYSTVRVKKVAPPPKTFGDIFTYTKCFSVKFCWFVASSYPHIYLPILVDLS